MNFPSGERRENEDEVSRHHTLAELKGALRRHRGSVSAAATSLGLRRQAVYARIQKSPELQLLVDLCDRQRTDLAELKLDQAIENGETWAIQFQLNKEGRSRGRGESGIQTSDQGHRPVESMPEREKQVGGATKPAAPLAARQTTVPPSEFLNSELGLPYSSADGALSEQDLLSTVGHFGCLSELKGCVMGVDQGEGLHIVVKKQLEGVLSTVHVHHESRAGLTFGALDCFMDAFGVRACVIAALPNTYAARDVAARYRGRVWLAYYSDLQEGEAAWGVDEERTPKVIINRTQAFDAWRNAFWSGKRGIPRVEGEVTEYVRQMTNVMPCIRADPRSGQKRVVWISRGPDHYAHADSFAELAQRRLAQGRVRASLLK